MANIASSLAQASTLWDLLSGPPADSTAIILPETNTRVTYGKLREQIQEMANTLAALGIQPGDRVATSLTNGLPAIVSFVAASMAGTAAPLNPGYRQDEVNFYLEDTSAKLLLAPAEGMDDARKAAADRKVPVYTLEMDETGYVRIAGASANGKKVGPPDPEAVALVLHTSGSTGRPKRVPIKHRNIAASARNIVATYDLSTQDTALCVMPLFHVHGLVASTISTLASGGQLVVPAKFNALSFWRTVRDNKVTWYSAVPTIHSMLLSRAGDTRPEGTETLRFIRSCSAALPADMMAKMEDVFGAPVLEAYGMTEASHQMASNPRPPKAHKGSSVGPATGIQIGIMTDGKLLPQGERGEVVIKGPNVVDGYENNPEANATSYVDGWFRTGDQGYLDEEGYLFLTGRLKEMINRGGEKIGPREIDEVLLQCPSVNEAIAFGVPHKSWGEEVAAAVTLKEGVTATEAEILAFCKERLADFKRPKKIYIVDAIPRTATGKIARGSVAKALAGGE
jgi:acyl-CoA synthetase (AMP-forming)/AMP-acid ligase II